MGPIQFETEIGADQILRVPDGIVLPSGPLRVTVVPCESAAGASDDLTATRDWLLRLAAEADADPTPLPHDLAKNHDYYAHGKPCE